MQHVHVAVLKHGAHLLLAELANLQQLARGCSGVKEKTGPPTRRLPRAGCGPAGVTSSTAPVPSPSEKGNYRKPSKSERNHIFLEETNRKKLNKNFSPWQQTPQFSCKQYWSESQIFNFLVKFQPSPKLSTLAEAIFKEKVPTMRKFFLMLRKMRKKNPHAFLPFPFTGFSSSFIQI